MDNNQGMTRLIPITSAGAVVALILFLGGNLFLGDRPLISGRSAGSEMESAAIKKFEREVRLWQDPFQAISAVDKEGCSGCWENIEPGDRITEHVLLAVLVREGRDAESVERRHRQRIAISSALSLEGYTPRSTEILVLLSVDWDTSTQSWKRCDKASKSGQAAERKSSVHEPDTPGDVDEHVASAEMGGAPFLSSDALLFDEEIDPNDSESAVNTNDEVGHVESLEQLVALLSTDENDTEHPPTRTRTSTTGALTTGTLKNLPPRPCDSPKWIPVEWYDRDPYGSSKAPPRSVLVAWLNEQVFGASLQSLDGLSAAISGASESPLPAGNNSWRTLVFGPATSTTLADWLSEKGVARGEFEELIAALGFYLDEGLTEPERVALRVNLDGLDLTSEDIGGARAAVSDFRSLLTGLAIRDSDPNWETAVVSRIIQEAPEDPIDSIANYLDDGLPSDVEEHLSSRTGANKGFGLPHTIAETVREALQKRDRDPLWAGRIITIWLLGELDRIPGWGDRQPDLRPEVAIYSTRATAPLTLLNAGLSSRNDSLSRRTQGLPVDNFHQMVASDDKLAEIVLDELPRRGVDIVGNPRHHLAIIGERDTLYGRLLPLVFEAEIQRRRSRSLGLDIGDIHSMLVSGWGSRAERVHRFSYLRGLDGEFPIGLTGAWRAGDSERGDSERTDNSLELLERSEGLAQLDQIRRIGDEIERRQSLLRHEGRGEIRAVGILGSDFYDKKLALQVLRPRFPGVIFFANDFDARYLHPADYTWFRGLLVASSFGLALNDELQRHVPPLRDSYSTATLFAALTALRDLDRTQSEETAVPVDGVSSLVVKPRLFEIGRGIAQDLTPFDRHSAIHPQPARALREGSIAQLSFLMTSVLGLSLASWRWRRYGSRGLAQNVLLACGATLALALLALSANYDGEGEAFAWASGASIWPSEILRLVAVLLGLFFLTRAMEDHAKLDKQVCDRLGICRAVGSSSPRRHLEWHFWNARRHLALTRRSWFLRSSERNRLDREAMVSIAAVWRRYRKVAGNGPRLARAAAGTFVLLGLLAALLALTSMPPAPYRGEIARWAHYVLEFASSALLILLTVWVLDVALFSSRFLRTLSSVRPAFPGRGRSTLRPVSELQGVKLAMQMASCYGPMLTYPMVIGAVLIVSRSRMFDDWTWHWSIVGLLLIALATSIGAIVVLWRRVRRVRSAALLRLREARLDLDELENRDDADRGGERRLSIVIEELTQMDEGVFASTLRRTLGGALLAPLGGALIVALLDWMVQFGF